MTNINCTLDCIYQIDGKCSYDEISSNSSLYTNSECIYFCSKSSKCTKGDVPL